MRRSIDEPMRTCQRRENLDLTRAETPRVLRLDSDGEPWKSDAEIQVLENYFQKAHSVRNDRL